MQKIIPGNIIEQKNVKSSSSENIYTVTLYDNCVSCTCPAGGRKTFSKIGMYVFGIAFVVSFFVVFFIKDSPFSYWYIVLTFLLFFLQV